MSVVRVEMNEAASQLSRLVELAEQGEDVLILRSGRPVARLVAVQRRRRVAEAFGALSGEIDLAEDFDERLVIAPDVDADERERRRDRQHDALRRARRLVDTDALLAGAAWR